MQRSVLGYLLHYWEYFVCSLPFLLSQETLWVSSFLFLNAFTNLVNTIHAFYGTLF